VSVEAAEAVVNGSAQSGCVELKVRDDRWSPSINLCGGG
jgi:hypothetical protein